MSDAPAAALAVTDHTGPFVDAARATFVHRAHQAAPALAAVTAAGAAAALYGPGPARRKGRPS
ncbi:hypothetical protein ACFVZD_34950 [Streptomyces sp. NPDC058287]|uniref:hypothetical protein n=1 Tax=unclassified Streptomyces TaxID=2593676 RepID=UPI0036DFF11E